MKKFFYLIVLVSPIAWAQTNTYPASGNVKIFATDQPWAEGVLVVKPSTWGGLRITRTDPSGGNYNGNWALGYNGNTGNDFSISTSYNGIQYDGLFHISNSTRNVGIGTTSPYAAKLHIDKQVIGDVGGSLMITNTAQPTVGNKTRLGFDLVGFDDITPTASIDGFLKNQNGATDLIFNAYDGSYSLANYERMRILGSNGNVGIGTPNPSAKLDIFTGGIGGLRVTGNTTSYFGADISIERTGTSTGVGKGSALQFDDNQLNSHAIIQNSIGGLQFFNLNDYSNGWVERIRIALDGKVGIGTTAPDALLTVSGQVHAQEVKVTVNAPGPDYVFERDYQLTSLEEIKNYIDQNKHLPEVPSAKEMEKNGVQLGEMNMLLLKKIEELTLYVIAQKNEIEEMKMKHAKEISEIKRLINK